jgi:MFS family permease
MESQQTASPYRWTILLLAVATNTLVIAAPSMGLPVLFKEIQSDLHLDLVQVGLIWGISSLSGILAVLAGGAIGDRFGPRRVLSAACVLIGITGGLRGLANSFVSLAAFMFLLGLVAPLLSMNTLKACGMWFPRRQLGLASGFLSMGMALGFLVGALFSATMLSPLLGGWRNVLYLYGGIAILIAIPWYFTRSAPAIAGATGAVAGGQMSIRQTLQYVARIRNLWLLGLTMLGFGGCVQGVLGYLPLYLRGQGWAPASADGALASFQAISMVCVIPIALLSDRLGTRKKVLLPATLMVTLGVSLLSFASGAAVWLGVCLAGMVRDGFMAVFMTAVIETEGVGVAYAGTATGMVMVFSGIGNMVSPALGNSLAGISPGLPFIFWAALTGLALIGLLGSREGSKKPVLASG